MQQHVQHHQQSTRSQGMTGHHQPSPQMQTHTTRYRALYDYDAQDVDEVSFTESDLIIECTPVRKDYLRLILLILSLWTSNIKCAVFDMISDSDL